MSVPLRPSTLALPRNGGGDRKWLWRGLAAVLLVLAWAASAAAQTELVPGYADKPAHGPEAAKGAVIWNHGIELVAESPSDPPFFVDYLQDAGWDVFSLKRRWAGDNYADSTAALVETVKRLRGEGYKRVVLAGQSFGAWISLAAATESAISVDAVIAAAPARFGRQGTSDNWTLNADRLYLLARDVKPTRVMTFLFDKDSYDPGGRGPILAAILKTRNVPSYVLDRPPGFEGHVAAATFAFAHTFGPCIVAFVEIKEVPADFSCKDYPSGPPEIGFALPANLRINPPPANVVPAFAPYSGKWFGLAPSGQGVMLIVHEMGVDRALAVYAWTAVSRRPNDRAGSSRRRGEFVAETRSLRFTEPRLLKIEATLRPDGKMDMVLAQPSGEGPSLTLVLRKLD